VRGFSTPNEIGGTGALHNNENQATMIFDKAVIKILVLETSGTSEIYRGVGKPTVEWKNSIGKCGFLLLSEK